MKAMNRALSIILLGVVIRSMYLHDQLYIQIFQENYWVIFYVIGIIFMMAALLLWLEPSKNMDGDK